MKSKQEWINDMKRPNPDLSHQRAIELFNDYFERVGTDLWRVRYVFLCVCLWLWNDHHHDGDAFPSPFPHPPPP